MSIPIILTIMTFYFITKYFILFIICLLFIGIINDYNNILILFLYFELLLLVTGLWILINAILYNAVIGAVFFIYITSIAAIKAAIGLSLIILFVKNCNTLNCFK